VFEKKINNEKKQEDFFIGSILTGIGQIRPCDPGTRAVYGLNDDEGESESANFFFPSTLF
jgi:hypothetical protein